MEAQERDEKVDAEDISGHKGDMTSVEPVMSIAAPVCDLSSDEVPAPVKDKIKSILTGAPSHEPLVFLDLVDPTHIHSDMHYEIFPLSVHYQDIDTHYEIFPISCAFKTT